jgi:CO/xanthine dehydrogenase Mo-binding subunit
LDQLKTENGVVFAASDKSKKVTYSELTKGQKIIQSVSEKPVLKKPGEFKFTGKSYLRADSLQKVTGKALYAADIRLPGLLNAKIVRPPAHGSKLISVDTSAAEAIKGVQIKREDDFIAVLHPDYEIAEQAVQAIKCKWEKPASKADNETIFAHILKTATNSRERYKGGSLETGKKESEFLFEHEYHDGYKAHASIEPHAATAIFENGKMTIWASSQTPFGTRQEVADTLKMPKEQVHLKQIFLGGGFGGKIYNRQAVEAARIAKMMEGTPIQLMWDRKEEFMYDMFRPAAVIKINSRVTKAGIIKY